MTTNRFAMRVMAGFLCLSSAGVWSARADAPPPQPLTAELDMSYLSAYVWRGQVYNDKGVVQPSLTVSKNGFSLNAWANYNAAGSYNGDDNRKFSEVDLTASYSHSVGPASLGVGVIQYLFPNQTVTTTVGPTTTSKAAPGTYEGYVTAGLPNIPLAPTLTVYHDMDQANGYYGTLGISQTFTICTQASAIVSASLGAADSEDNKFYFGKDTEALNDADIGLAVPITVANNLTVKPGVTYSFFPDSGIADAAGAIYGHKERVVGSVTVSYTF